ncbi:MAG TPA: hypothetical protein VKX46_16510, partial [Ktedonobacteraceae bacterium]|nr:hypothetical protein [Ktedonobacteraceae bacterium]
TTGKEKFGSPLLIRAALRGKGYDNVNGIVSFHAQTQNQRAALLLLHGVIYVTWGAFGDTDPYHGWVIGYAYNAAGFHQLIASVYNDTLNGSEGGIWMGGSGPAADASNNLYLSTGNGDANIGNGGTEASDSFIKLNTTIGLRVSDYFSPYNHVCLDGRDADLGSGGVIALPDQPGTAHPHLLVSSGKEGRVYVIDRDHMGKYTNDPNLQCDGADAMRTDVDKVVQELAPSVGGSVFGVGGYWSGSASSGQMIYIGGYNDHLKAFQLKNDLLSSAAVSQSSEIFAFSGATPSISSNGSQPGTGIVWISSPSSCSDPGCQPAGPGALRAYDATNLNVELYNSEQNPARDELDSYIKFGVPTIADGHVFVGTQTSLTIYGLLNQ